MYGANSVNNRAIKNLRFPHPMGSQEGMSYVGSNGDCPLKLVPLDTQSF